MNKVTLKNVELVEEKTGEIYLDLTYRCEDDKHIKEVHMPRVRLDLSWNGDIDLGDERATICLGDDNRYELYDTNTEARFTIRIIEEKVQELTLTEIEKKLGYKIKIVNDK